MALFLVTGRDDYSHEFENRFLAVHTSMERAEAACQQDFPDAVELYRMRVDREFVILNFDLVDSVTAVARLIEDGVLHRAGISARLFNACFSNDPDVRAAGEDAMQEAVGMPPDRNSDGFEERWRTTLEALPAEQIARVLGRFLAQAPEDYLDLPLTAEGKARFFEFYDGYCLRGAVFVNRARFMHHATIIDYEPSRFIDRATARGRREAERLGEMSAEDHMRAFLRADELQGRLLRELTDGMADRQAQKKRAAGDE